MHPLKTIAFVALLSTLGCVNNNGVSKLPAKGAGMVYCSSPQLIPVYKEWVYDLNGYEGVAFGTAFNLFDENSFVDPKGRNEYHPQTSPHPYPDPAKYFPLKKGNRIVVDLQTAYKINEVYLYDRSRQSDSVWIYTGTMTNWKLKGAMMTKGDITQWGWKKFTIDDSSRYIMFRFNSWEADITEAAMYGCVYGKVSGPPKNIYTGARLPAKSIKEFLGINMYNGSQMQWMKPFYNTRMYTSVSHYDTDTTSAFPDVLYRPVGTGWYNNGTNDYYIVHDSIVRVNQNKIWLSLLGVPLWMEKKGYGNHDRPVTKIGMDTEDPSSYKRHANLLWNLAAAFGSTAVDTNEIQSSITPRFSGRNTIQIFENGNEADANWVGNKYCNPMEYFALSTADYDGHENSLGKKMGIVNADPNSQLMMAGFTSLDTNRVRILDFISRTSRTDHKFIWQGGIQYHHYSTNGKGRLAGEVFSTASGGASPEEDSLRKRLAKVRDYTYRIQPGVECILGEWGYDKNRNSKVSTPLVPGFNEAQSQGIMLLRGINAVAFSGFDKLIIYWMRDDENGGQPNLFLSAGLVGAINSSDQRPYESWYYITTMINQLGDYIPEKIISESGNVWVYKYRHKSDPSQKAYFVYCPTHNGTTVDGYLLKTGRLADATATEISLLDNSTSGNVIQKSVGSNGITLKVTEAPKFILVKER